MPLRAVPDPVVRETSTYDDPFDLADHVDRVDQADRENALVTLFAAEDQAADAAPTTGRGWSVGSFISPWLPRGRSAIITGVALLAAGGAACALWWRPLRALQTSPRSIARVEAPVAAPPAAVHAAAPLPAFKLTGRLSATSDPTAARVLVDGKLRGVTPVVISDLTPGNHVVVLESTAGSIHRSVTIAAGATAEIAESIFAGWVQVVAPFDIAIAENGRALALDDRGQVMLPPGRHELHVQNRVLDYEDLRPVEVTPGVTTTLSIVPPRTTMTVTSSAPATVWIDGISAGDAPATASVDLGTHEVVVKPAAGATRKFTVTATAKPVRLDVDLSKTV
jgi:PEGA domain-containing protein